MKKNWKFSTGKWLKFRCTQKVKGTTTAQKKKIERGICSYCIRQQQKQRHQLCYIQCETVWMNEANASYRVPNGCVPFNIKRMYRNIGWSRLVFLHNIFSITVNIELLFHFFVVLFFLSLHCSQTDRWTTDAIASCCI